MWQLILLSVLALSQTPFITTKEVDKEAVLERHNYHRSLVGVGDLQYSIECAEYAQDWANNLAEKDKMKHSTTDKYGENICSSSSPMNINDVIDYWATEKENFDTEKRTHTYESGHYTQLVWRNTKFVGMGMAIAEDGTEYWVATYYPAGNIVGQKTY